MTDLFGGVSETKLEEEKGEEVQAGGQKQARLTSGGPGDSVGQRGKAAGGFRAWGCAVPGTTGALGTEAKLIPQPRAALPGWCCWLLGKASLELCTENDCGPQETGSGP